MAHKEQHQFTDLLVGRLTGTSEAEVLAHIESCAECRQAFESYKQIYSVSELINQRQSAVGAAFSVQVMEQLEQEQTKVSSQPVRRFTRLMPSLAFAVTACLTVVLATNFLGSEASKSFQSVGSSLANGNAGTAYSSTDSWFRGDSSKQQKPGQPRTFSKADYSDGLTREAQPPAAPREQDKKGFIDSMASVTTAAESNLTGSDRGITAGGKAPGAFSEPAFEDRHGWDDLFVSMKNHKKGDAHSRANEPPAAIGNPTYGQYDENARLFVTQEPLSTFSIDVDTGSYTNTRGFLQRGQLPPQDAVRIEEFLNYFDYDLVKPSDKPFAVTYEAAPSPLEKDRYLLRIGVKAKEAVQDKNVGWNLVFLVDTSGSMGPENRLPLVRESLKMLAHAMRPIDRIALVAYSGNAGLVLDSTPGTEKQAILQAIENLSSGGSTNGGAGIDLAYNVAERNFHAHGVNRVILATDGDFNVGNYSFPGLLDLVEKKKASGVTLTTIGVGDNNYNEKNLEQLADKGNGNYIYLDTLQEAERTLLGRLSSLMQVVAKDVKIQVEFNPQVVAAYRLVGYDNRKLATEDFNNDRVDAGEVGSGHAVTALYEIALKDTPFAKSLLSGSRYTSHNEDISTTPAQDANKAGELAFVKIRYKEPEGSVSQLLEFPLAASEMKNDPSKTSADFRFAAAVSYFGHMLRASKYVGEYQFAEVAELAEASLGGKQDEKRKEFVALVQKAAQLRGGVR